MRRIATGLVVLAFLAGGTTLASATGWGGWGGWEEWDSGHIQYKKKKFCDLIRWLYEKNGTWKGKTQGRTGYGKTGYGWWDLDDLIEFCFEDDERSGRGRR